MNVNEFFNVAGSTRNKEVVCADGFKMSVQAHEFAYCEPRVNNAQKYTSVEIGFPNRSEELLLEYAETPQQPTDTVYAYVPIRVVNLVLAKHGGIVEGQVPRGVAPIPAKFVADK